MAVTVDLWGQTPSACSTTADLVESHGILQPLLLTHALFGVSDATTSPHTCRARSPPTCPDRPTARPRSPAAQFVPRLAQPASRRRTDGRRPLRPRSPPPPNQPPAPLSSLPPPRSRARPPRCAQESWAFSRAGGGMPFRVAARRWARDADGHRARARRILAEGDSVAAPRFATRSHLDFYQ